MIVDPDFMDHWRTGMVADAIGDPMAAIYILRLWAHCQDRKSDTFVMPTAGLKAQCKCPAPAEVFEKALVDAGFLSRDGDTITVLGWAEKNASLLAAWENGSKGGRPKKNPAETHGKPTGNPSVAHGQPIANPDETDKSREEKNPPKAPKGARRAVTFKTWAEETRGKGEKLIPDDDPVFAYAADVQLPVEFVALAWSEFKTRHVEPGAKQYKNFRQAFLNCVRGNWYKLWISDGEGVYRLTTTGTQAKAAREAREQREEQAASAGEAA